ncbi:MAG: LLM class flavin-dependent oxidoreductase [Acetobacteraceae bacterium]|nr:LLM class flavin-dependent oxidoreductase [Acetobacteraceae bacterium]MSP30719.1 LLM class flavin-dependent oxidoreductase [Acetobacteraceae bacterium]
MEFGVFHEFPSLVNRPDAEAFAEAFAIVDGAERYGLDVMWLGEFHFDPARSVLSSPMCIASAIAMRTQRIKIGVAVQVLPLGNPLRLAEEAATVDQISGGRLIFGAGRSGVAKTYEAYNIPYIESRDRFAEALEIIERAWRQENFSHAGKFYQFANVSVTPRPLRTGGPPIRIAATSADTFITIGQQGRPIFLAVRHEDARVFAPNIAAYRNAWRQAGHAGNGQVYLRTPGYIAVTEAQARAEAEASLIHYYRAQGVLLADSARRAGVDAADRRAKTSERLMTITYDEALRGSLMIGTPETVITRLRGLQKDLGLDGVLIELNCGGKVAHAHELAAMRLLGEDVMPAFR